MSGKGSSPRPYSVPKESFDQSFERIFGITCKRCGKRGLKPDSVHTCSPQINEPRIAKTIAQAAENTIKQPRFLSSILRKLEA